MQQEKGRTSWRRRAAAWTPRRVSPRGACNRSGTQTPSGRGGACGSPRGGCAPRAGGDRAGLGRWRRPGGSAGVRCRKTLAMETTRSLESGGEGQPGRRIPIGGGPAVQSNRNLCGVLRREATARRASLPRRSTPHRFLNVMRQEQTPAGFFQRGSARPPWAHATPRLAARSVAAPGPGFGFRPERSRFSLLTNR